MGILIGRKIGHLGPMQRVIHLMFGIMRSDEKIPHSVDKINFFKVVLRFQSSVFGG
jgi:hypothetical protein